MIRFNLIDIAILIVVLLIIGIAVIYIIKAKKKGVKCIGCPSGSTCGGNCSSCSTAHQGEE